MLALDLLEKKVDAAIEGRVSTWTGQGETSDASSRVDLDMNSDAELS